MINKSIARKLWYHTLRIRMVEERIALEYPKGEIRCPTHLCIGQEAIAAGVCTALRQEDIVFSYHRSHGHYLAKGGNLPAFIAELYGKATGCSGGWGGSQHLIDTSVNFAGAIPIVGETVPLAVGAAFAAQMKGEKVVAVAFFGEAATEEGVVSESLNFAALKRLPILFVCENNFYSICTPLSERQPKRKIYKWAQEFGMQSYACDGNDAVNVYEMTSDTLRSVRRGQGPAFCEFLTYRMREHCGPNIEPEGWRPKKEFTKWKLRDPIMILKKQVLEKKLLTNTELLMIERELTDEINHAFAQALKSPFPSQTLLEEYVYHSP